MSDFYFPVPDPPGDLIDGDLVLRLRETQAARPAEGWVAAMCFDMVHAESGAKMGGIQLRLGITDELLYHGGQIGYGVDPEYRGRRYSARAVRLVLPLAKQAGMEELWITCDPTNIASKRSIEIAGGELVEVRTIAEWSPMYQMGRRETCRFRFALND